jgi:site-specific DNA recombinase
MFRAAIVAAVSTPEQAREDRESIPEQLADCREACARHGWNVVREIVIPGHSREYWTLDAIVADCPEYAELVRLITDETVNLVVCMRLARLCRTVDLMVQVTTLCTQHRAQVYSVREPQEPTPPERIRKRRGVAGVMNLFAMALSEEEQQVRVERLHQGMVRRIHAGLPSHSRLGQYGYDRAVLPSDLPPVNEEEARWVRWMYERRCRGWGYEHIAAALNDRGVASPRGGIWHGTAVRKIVTNPLYKGAVKWGEHVNENGQHTPLVEPDTWERAQAVGVGFAQHSPRTLTGIAKCGMCGWSMSYWQAPSTLLLRCSHYSRSRGHICYSNGQAAAPIEAEVLRVVREVANDPERYAAYSQPVDDVAPERKLLETNLARVQSGLDRWAQAYEAGVIGLVELRERRAALEEQAESIARELHKLDRLAARRDAVYNRLDDLALLLSTLDDYTPTELNAVLRLIVERVECVRGQPPKIVLL